MLSGKYKLLGFLADKTAKLTLLMTVPVMISVATNIMQNMETSSALATTAAVTASSIGVLISSFLIAGASSTAAENYDRSYSY